MSFHTSTHREAIAAMNIVNASVTQELPDDPL